MEGLKHFAVVIADNEKEAVKLAKDVEKNNKTDPRVLYGGVGEWELSRAFELVLPKGYEIRREKAAKKSRN